MCINHSDFYDYTKLPTFHHTLHHPFPTQTNNLDKPLGTGSFRFEYLKFLLPLPRYLNNLTGQVRLLKFPSHLLWTHLPPWLSVNLTGGKWDNYHLNILPKRETGCGENVSEVRMWDGSQDWNIKCQTRVCVWHVLVVGCLTLGILHLHYNIIFRYQHPVLYNTGLFCILFFFKLHF